MAQAGALSDFPYAYTLRRSRRAKKIILKVSPEKGLELVVPWRVAYREALKFLIANQAWVEKHHACLAPKDLVLPQTIELPAIGETLLLDYQFDETLRPRCRVNFPDVQYCGPRADETVLNVLVKAVGGYVKPHLMARLETLSQQHNLPYQAVSFRRQRTRWGSCTTDKKIQLNYKLAFVAPHLVDYVMVHELCHTVHQNHSPAFWALVTQCMPDARTWDRALRQLNFKLPPWFV